MEKRFENKLRDEFLKEHAKNLLIISQSRRERKYVVDELLHLLRNIRIDGYYTEDLFEGNVRTGLIVKSLKGSGRILAKTTIESMIKVGPFKINVDAVEHFINPIIEHCIRNCDFLLMDQIGRIELMSGQFKQLVKQAFDSKLKIIATIPNYRMEFLEQLRRRPDVISVQINAENMKEWPNAIIRSFVSVSLEQERKAAA